MYKLLIFRSNRYLFAQVIDSERGKTILGLSDKILAEKEKVGTKVQRAKMFGIKFGETALKKKVRKVIFDRGGYRYHGRIKAFAEGAREGGLEL